MSTTLPSIPAKRYFTIGEVAELCGVKTHVLRYWEQEFTQLRPVKRRGNRRYYQHHEVLMIRRIRDLLYEQGFTISGARNKLQELAQAQRATSSQGVIEASEIEVPLEATAVSVVPAAIHPGAGADLQKELREIRALLTI
jgi:DNA-binding transcriptional MerR regulator